MQGKLPSLALSRIFRVQAHAVPRRALSILPKSLYLDVTDPALREPCNTRVASIAVVGAPNAGKSSLTNSMIENRVSAVSRKMNTTRRRMVGAYTSGSRQLVFWDTPGVVERQFVKSLGDERRELTTSGWGSAADADVAMMVIDASRGEKYWERCARITEQLGQIRGEVNADKDGETTPGLLLVLNKCDVTRPRTRLLEAISYFREKIENFEALIPGEIYMVSAYNGKGVHDLRDVLLDMTKPGEFEVPDGTTYCEDDLDLIREHIWEKLLHRVHQEVPYRCRFENDKLMELPNGDLYVSEVIRVPRARSVPIVIGPRGSIIQWVREAAMESASAALGRKVHLTLRVAVA